MTLPELDTPEPPGWMRERLARWLRDWQLDRAMRTRDTESPDQTHPRVGALPEGMRNAAAAVAPPETEPPPAIGQIRLLAPDCDPCREAPLYFLLMGRSKGEPGGFVVIPFSRFAEPATDGELRVEGVAPGVGVLQVWNAMALPGRFVSRSWLSSELSGAVLDAAWAVYRHALAGEELPEFLRERVGAPLLHPDDPRHEYVEEETERTDALQLYVAAMQNQPPPPLVYERPTTIYAVAAERRGAYGVSRYYRIEGADAVIRTAPGDAPGTQTILVETPAGEPDFSFDGAILRAPSGTESEAIRQARAPVPDALLAEPFWIITPDGSEHCVIPS